MGHEANASCRDCGHTFTLSDGGGFLFHLLRCDKCGKTKSIDFGQLGELHLRYLKGLSGPYCIASREHDKAVRENANIEPISEREYYQGIEKIAGKCGCHGKFLMNAPPRCPKCRSIDIEEGEATVMYD